MGQPLDELRAALAHLHDPGRLQSHPLASAAGGGKALRAALEDAIAAIKPSRDGKGGARAERRYELLRLRYLDALGAEEVQRKLLVSRSEYYREHSEALASVAGFLSERSGGTERVASAVERRGAGGEALSTLPRPLTSFVGRDHEVAEVKRRLGAARLVTLVGAPGTGKTRLALRVAADVAEQFADEVAFVSLGAVADPELVLPTIGHTLGLAETPGRGRLDSLVGHLRERRMLLVLDNFEQVVAAGPAIAKLLASCPGITALATSRELLRVSGEHGVTIPPLGLPEPGETPSAEVLLRYDAVRLFVERAQETSSEVTIADEDAPIVAEICARLDGLPLAIELAAARVRLLPPRVLLARLDTFGDRSGHRLPVLTGGARDLPDRQRTLRAAIAWSHDLLDAPERALFRRLGVFVGGATLDAIEAVCGRPDLDVLDHLGSLVDKSLVRRKEAPDEARFVMLETIREYALEQLEASGEADELRRAHAEQFLELVEAAESPIWGGNGPAGEQRAWLDRLEREHDNLRATLRWAIERGQSEAGLRMVGALFFFWMTRGSRSEARAWADQVLAMAAGGTPTRARVQALATAAMLAWLQGDLGVAEPLAQQSLAVAQESGDRLAAALAGRPLGFVARASGDYAGARAHHERSLAVFRELGTPTQIAFDLFQLAMVAHDRGEPDVSRRLCEESLALFREAEDDWGLGLAYRQFGIIALADGDVAAAAGHLEKSLSHYEALGDRGGIADAQHILAVTLVRLGEHARARELYRRSLPALRDQLNRAQLTDALAGMALLAAATERPARALRLAAAAAALGAPAGHHLPGAMSALGSGAELEHALAEARRALGDEAADAARAEGQALTLGQAIAEALADV
jgi:predicted ATPase